MLTSGLQEAGCRQAVAGGRWDGWVVGWWVEGEVEPTKKYLLGGHSTDTRCPGNGKTIEGCLYIKKGRK